MSDREQFDVYSLQLGGWIRLFLSSFVPSFFSLFVPSFIVFVPLLI